MNLLVATRNQGKLAEIRVRLAVLGWRVEGLSEHPGLPEIVEDGSTFEANARKKAATIARLTGRLTLADDSGLVVEALGGAPGVHSARYAGENASDAENNRLLLKNLEGMQGPARAAAFHCVMALCPPAGLCEVVTGEVRGQILEAPRGSGGFGYDPLFFLPELGRTMAELPLEVKNRISHRGAALSRIIGVLAAAE